MKIHGRYREEVSLQELIEMVFGCVMAGVIVGHIVVNGERPSVDGHFYPLAALAGFFTGVAFNRPVVLMIREWRGKGERTREHPVARDESEGED